MQHGGWRRRVLVLALTAALAACSDGGDDDETARASVPDTTTTSSSTTTSTTAAVAQEFEPLPADPALSPEEQVEAAYLYSWEVYLDALATGRTDDLDAVYTEPSLSARRSAIEARFSDGQIVKGAVEHDYRVTVVEPELAIVVDSYRNHLVLTDATTGEPLEADPDEAVTYQYTLEKRGESWLVSFVERV